MIDSGIGIKKEKIKDLFTPFHQMDSSITRKYGGTGLGLSISKKFVELLDGEIYAESEYGKGSKFVFHLPLTVNKEIKENDITELYPDLRDIQVLVYEEDEITEKLVVSYLKSYHLKVECAMSPEDVLRKLRSKEIYQLLIMDINLKTSDSLEIIQLLNKPEIKIILLAKNIREAQYEMAENLGVKHIIMKPVISSILYNSIVQCFEEEVKEESREETKRTVNNNGINILLAEDNEVNQLIEKEILSQQGYTVQIAENGRIAVDMCKEDSNLHMVLMDIHMPEMDGYEATEKIREFNKKIPILAMTAVSFFNIKDKCEEVGMNGYITKPFEPKEMFRTIKEHLNSGEDEVDLSEASCECEAGCSYLDIQQGMLRIGNNEKLYYEVLEKYLFDLKDAKKIVEAVSKTENYESIEKVVHKLKGTSGNIGAIELYQVSKILMDAIHSRIETDIEPYYVEFVSVFNETERIVEKCLHTRKKENDVQQESEKKETVVEQRKTYLNLIHLNDLLIKSDLDSFKLAEAIDQEISFYQEWEEVKIAMKNYQFKEAAEKIKRVLEIYQVI